jgi:hypothetical protein
MADRMSEHGDEVTWVYYDDRGSSIMAFLIAVLLNAAIIGIFMLITWAAYNTH